MEGSDLRYIPWCLKMNKRENAISGEFINDIKSRS